MSGTRAAAAATAMSCLVLVGCSDDSAQQQQQPGSEVEILRPIKLADRARLPEKDPAFDKVTISDSRLVFHYSREPTVQLAAGDLVGGRGYLRRLVKVSRSPDGSVVADTERAFLTEFIRDGHFRVRLERRGWTPADAGAGDGGADGSIRSRSSALSWTLAGTTWKECFGAGAKVRPILKLFFDFGESEIDIDDFELKKLAFIASLGADFGHELKTTTASPHSVCQTNILDLMNGGLLQAIDLPTFTIPPGVVITHSLSPAIAVTGVADVAIAKVNTLGVIKYRLDAGIKYENGHWSKVWDSSTDQSELKFVTEPSNLEHAKINLETLFELRYKALVFDTAGPVLGVNLTAPKEIEVDTSQCQWDGKLSFKVDGVAGVRVQVPLVGATVWEKTWSFPLAKTTIKQVTGEPFSAICPDASVPPDVAPDTGVRHDTTVAAPCPNSAIGAVGCCVGQLLLSCSKGLLHSTSCATQPRCGWSVSKGAYDCNTAGKADPTRAHPQSCQSYFADAGSDGPLDAGVDTTTDAPSDAGPADQARDTSADGRGDQGSVTATCPGTQLTFKGCCSGEQLWFCSDGKLHTLDCTGAPKCGWDPMRELYNCTTPGGTDPSGVFSASCGTLLGDAGVPPGCACLLDSTCYREGELNPDDACQSCVAATATDVWTLSSAPTCPSCATKPSSLVAWWRAENNADDALAAHPGTLQGSAGFGAGRTGHGLRLDGVDDYVSVPGHAALYSAGSFSLEAWIKTSAPFGSVITRYECGGVVCDGSAAYRLQVNTGVGLLYVRDNDGGGPNPDGGQVLTGTATLADGKWHHLVAVRDVSAAQLRLYVDGALDAQAALHPNMAGPLSGSGENDPLLIGAASKPSSTPGVNGLFAGSIDEVGYYGAALSATQVAALYAAGGAGKCP